MLLCLMSLPVPCVESGESACEEPSQLPDKLPERLRFVPPDHARKGADGKDILTYVVLCDGTTSRIKVLETGGADLDRAAIEAVRQWTYKPATLNGTAVAFSTSAVIIFNRGNDPSRKGKDAGASDIASTFIGKRGRGAPDDLFNERSAKCWEKREKKGTPYTDEWHNRCFDEGRALGLVVCARSRSGVDWSCGIAFGLPFGKHVDAGSEGDSGVAPVDSIVFFSNPGLTTHERSEVLEYKLGACEVPDVTRCRNDAVAAEIAEGWCHEMDKHSRCLGAIRWLKDKVSETGEDPAAAWTGEGVSFLGDQ